MADKKITAFPLCWPDGWPRTVARKHGSPYKTTFGKAFDDAADSLRLFKAFGVVISTDVPLRRDGRPYADGDPRDSGIAVYFTRGKQQYAMACDLWVKAQHNMRAVGLAIDGLRAVERSGATQILDRAFAGFAALPSGGGGPVERPWEEVLNLVGLAGPSFAVRAAIEASFRELSRTRHPDVGGSHEAMLELNAARARALESLLND